MFLLLLGTLTVFISTSTGSVSARYFKALALELIGIVAPLDTSLVDILEQDYTATWEAVEKLAQVCLCQFRIIERYAMNVQPEDTGKREAQAGLSCAWRTVEEVSAAVRDASRGVPFGAGRV